MDFHRGESRAGVNRDLYQPLGRGQRRARQRARWEESVIKTRRRVRRVNGGRRSRIGRVEARRAKAISHTRKDSKEEMGAGGESWRTSQCQSKPRKLHGRLGAGKMPQGRQRAGPEKFHLTNLEKVPWQIRQDKTLKRHLGGLKNVNISLGSSLSLWVVSFSQGQEPGYSEQVIFQLLWCWVAPMEGGWAGRLHYRMAV